MRYRFLIRPLMKAADRVRRLYRRLRGKPLFGVMVLPYAPDGKLILIRQTYAPGWCLPGGGRGPAEDPVAAALRELREEIGLVGWTAATWTGSFAHRIAGMPASIDLVRVDGAEFSFRANLEVESISTFEPAALPADMNRWSARFIMAAADLAR